MKTPHGNGSGPLPPQMPAIDQAARLAMYAAFVELPLPQLGQQAGLPPNEWAAITAGQRRLGPGALSRLLTAQPQLNGLWLLLGLEPMRWPPQPSGALSAQARQHAPAAMAMLAGLRQLGFAVPQDLEAVGALVTDTYDALRLQVQALDTLLDTLHQQRHSFYHDLAVWLCHPYPTEEN